MSQRPSGHLRVFRADDPQVPADMRWGPILEACQAFSRATGWPLRFVAAPESQTEDPDLLWSAPVDPGVGNTPGHLRIDLAKAREATHDQRIDLDVAQELGTVLARVFAQLLRSERTLRHREAELAVAVPVIAQPEHEQQLLADRLEHCLQAAAQVVGGVGAALYLLDDATTELKLRAAHGLSYLEFTEPARSLQGAIADLEALLGHAVTLEDDRLSSYWKVPYDCGAAICVPVSSPTVPLGTLWVFCEHPQPFSDQEVNLIEIVAGRIAADLEREMLLREATHGRMAGIPKPEPAAEVWHSPEAVPDKNPAAVDPVTPISPVILLPEVPGWEIAAGQSPATSGLWAAERRDDLLQLCAGIVGRSADHRGQISAQLLGLVRAMSELGMPPEDLLALLRRDYRGLLDEEDALSLWIGQIDLRTGQLAFSTAGRPAVWQRQVGGRLSLLPARPALGVQPEPNRPGQSLQLARGEGLLVFNGIPGLEPEGFLSESLPAGNPWQSITPPEFVQSVDQLVLRARQNAGGLDRTILWLGRSID